MNTPFMLSFLVVPGSKTEPENLQETFLLWSKLHLLLVSVLVAKIPPQPQI